MVRITKVYTRKGDLGTTRMTGSKPLSKSSARIKTLGALDELNAFLGWAIVILAEKTIFNDLQKNMRRIQNTLFDLGAELVVTTKKIEKKGISDQDVKTLENEIDTMNQYLSALNSFVLPGTEEISARLHIVRTVCRRAERALVTLNKNQHTQAIAYLNRLSDWFFVAARFVTYKLDVAELLWEPGKR